MMGPTFLPNLAAYSLQVAVVAGVGSIMMMLLRFPSPIARYNFWRAILALCLILPFVQTAQNIVPQQAETIFSFAAEAASAPPASTRAALAWRDALTFIPAVLIIGIVVRLSWIAIGLVRLSTLRRSGEIAPLAEQLSVVGTRAEIRCVIGLQQPVSFGIRAPIILLPSNVKEQSPEIQQAVLCHELLHVQRKDWAWLLAEESVRGVLWFHPAIWWLIRQIHTAREEVIDREVIARTRNRRAYMEALLTFSDQMPLTPATAFGRRRQLFRRIRRISKEVIMSRRRLLMSSAVLALIVIGGTWYAVRAFPMQTASEIGPLERQAKPITPETPIPRRVYRVFPQYPQQLVSSGVGAFVTANITLDSSGRVAEARLVREEISGNGQDPQQGLFWTATNVALTQWQYEPPAAAPIAFPVSFRFAPTGQVFELNAPVAPVPEWHDGAVRVEGLIRPPRLLTRVPPVYPPDAKAAGVSGVVLLEARVETDGHIRHTRMLRSIPQLDAAAIEAVEKWEFAPAVDPSGELIPAITVITISFTLQ
jgi:TonB family protein